MRAVSFVCMAVLLGLSAPAITSTWSVVAQDRKSPPPVESMTSARALDRMIIRTVSQIMDQQHLSKHSLDDEISERAFKQFIKSLDPLKQYFLKEDIEKFAAERTRLDDYARGGEMDFAIRAFKTFLKRVDERVAMAHEEIDKEHDFTLDEQIAIDADALDYPVDDAEARDRLRRQIKFRMLAFESEKLRAERDEAAGKTKSETEAMLQGDLNEDPRERLHRTYRTLHKRWHQTDADELLELYVSAITTSFDPHTSYMSPDSFENFRIIMSLNLDGIGAQLMSEDGYTKLTSIVPGGAADKDGRLKPGDKILAVGQGESGPMVDVIDMKLDDVVQQIRGTAGTVVRLSVMPANGGETQLYDITRAKITLDDSAARSEVVEYGQKADGSRGGTRRKFPQHHSRRLANLGGLQREKG